MKCNVTIQIEILCILKIDAESQKGKLLTTFSNGSVRCFVSRYELHRNYCQQTFIRCHTLKITIIYLAGNMLHRFLNPILKNTNVKLAIKNKHCQEKYRQLLPNHLFWWVKFEVFWSPNSVFVYLLEISGCREGLWDRMWDMKERGFWSMIRNYPTKG